MFNSVQFVRDICQERKIPISQLEKECGFSNGYLNPKKMSKIAYDRAQIIANYLGISVSMIMAGEEEQKEKPLVNDDEELTEYLEILKTRPEMRMLFQISKDATKEDVEAAVRVIEAIRKK